MKTFDYTANCFSYLDITTNSNRPDDKSNLLQAERKYLMQLRSVQIALFFFLFVSIDYSLLHGTVCQCAFGKYDSTNIYYAPFHTNLSLRIGELQIRKKGVGEEALSSWNICLPTHNVFFRVKFEVKLDF